MKLYHEELGGGLDDINLNIRERLEDGKERLLLGLSNLIIAYYTPDELPEPRVRMTYSTSDQDLLGWKQELEDSQYTQVTRDRAGGTWTAYRNGANQVEFRGSEVVVEFEETIDDIPGYKHLDGLDRISTRIEDEDGLVIEYDEERPRYFGQNSPYRIK
ncbi:MAG: hypothetical protein SVU32_04535 [Candidatus Nanohaloarchaea archaeon]|nr:hypothetical protein [Candidatus Nanohaloarchaea archaeon]